MELLELDPPSGLQVAPDLRNESFPIRDAAADAAGVDVVEAVRVDPRARDIVDEEGDVGRDYVRLDRAEVGSGYVRGWVVFREFYRPCSSA